MRARLEAQLDTEAAQTMISERTIREAVERIVSTAKPSKVILFGSHAGGDAQADSDLDFLVIEPEVVDRGAEMVRLRRAVGDIGKGVDILVYSASEVEQRKDWCTSALYWALREGRVVYDTAVQ